MTSENRAGRLYLTAIGFGLCLIAGLFLWLMTRSYLRARDMNQWPQCPCLVLSSAVEETRIAENVAPEFRLVVLYRYEHQGKEYESTRWGIRGSLPRSNRAVVEEQVAQYPAGKWCSCKVNPQKPEIAVLKADSQAAGYSLWFPGLFFFGGLGMMIGAWKRPRQNHVGG
jgi:Protein of unknown function (DUF3592)